MKVRTSNVWYGARADISISETGQMTPDNFNIWLKRGEIFLIHFLTGNITNAGNFPMPYETQKCKDYLKNFITKKEVNNGFVLPDDYYQWDNLYKIGSYNATIGCENEGDVKRVENCDKPIEILDGQEFKSRCTNEIEEMNPTLENPIAKIINSSVETEPTDVGSMRLEYIRYPKFGKLVMKKDEVFNTIVVDEDLSGELEWDMWALEYLIWKVKDYYYERTRNKSGFEFNSTKKPE